MGKVILITGSSTGIGAECAKLLAKGNDVIVHYNSSRDAAENVVNEVKLNGGRAITVQADLTSEKGCVSLANFVKEKFGKLDVLVNNAGGILKRETVSELSWEIMEKTFRLNVYSLMKMTSLCTPLLEKGINSCIVNISSIAARHGAPTGTIYGAAKGAVDTFTRGCAKELAPKIRVNAVAPGVIDTPFHTGKSTPEQFEAWKNNTPLQRIGEAKDIAHAVRFLVQNSFITGETVDVNGGLYMR